MLLKERLPAFVLAKNAEIPPGCQLYQWEPGPGLHCYLELVVDPKPLDRFNVLVGWSRNGRVPLSITSARLEEDPPGGDVLGAINQFWDKKPKEPYPWDLAPFDSLSTEGWNSRSTVAEAIGKMPPIVEEVVDRVARHCVPYFQGVANRHGIANSDPSVIPGGAVAKTGKVKSHGKRGP